jgi:DNA-binding transcriptional MerR regulator
MPEAQRKSELAFRTIGELAGDLGIPQHILRYWETRFPQLKPLQRAGNRRYYRPDDVALAKRIHRLLNQDGYTIRGVQQLLRRGPAAADDGAAHDGAAGGEGRGAGEAAAGATSEAGAPTPANQHAPFPADRLRAIRKLLADALSEEN